MSKRFNYFISENENRIKKIAESLKVFEIDAKTIGIKNAKERVVNWIKNFDNIGFTDLELVLHLLEKIDFIEFNFMTDKIIQDSEKLVKKKNTYITYLGEPNESSFKIASKFHRHPNYKLSLPILLNDLPDLSGNKILLFDDFLNSGGQLVSIFYALLNIPLPNGEINDESEFRTNLTSEQCRKLKNSEIHLFYYQVFDEGIKKIEQRIKKELKVKLNIHSHYFTNNNDSVFGDLEEQIKIQESEDGTLKHRSLFQGKNYSDLTEFYNILKQIGLLLLKHNEKKWDSSKYLSRALGYGNLCRVIITNNNVPTITLTAIWQNGSIRFNNKKINWSELLPRKKKIIRKIKKANSEESEKLSFEKIGMQLQELYENDEIREGIIKSEHFFKKYGLNTITLKHLLRFNLRDKNCSRIKKIIKEFGNTELDDEQFAMCKYALFECSLRGCYEYRTNTIRFSKAVKKIRKHLNEVPTSQKKGAKYNYLLGRWFLDFWWAYRETNNLSNLTQALSSFNYSIRIKDTWWAQCYKCISLKLLNNVDFENETYIFHNRIFDFLEKKPNQPSVKMFCITSLILLDKKTELEAFLRSMSGALTPTDFEDTLVHRIELIYHGEEHKILEYKKTINSWIKSIPRK